MEKKPFTELGVSPEVLKAVEKMGFEEASPIQTAAIPVLMKGGDVVGQSQTGSGKTAAFGIPIIEKVDAELREPQALILCPTRELVVQVAEEISKLASFKRGVRELPIYGGASYDRQFRGLESGVQIIVGAPGRVIDHLERGSLSMANVKTVVLDEADRMLDMGFREDIERILSEAPAERQTVLFSATMPREIRELIKKFTREPQYITIESKELTAPEIEQLYYEVQYRSKVEVLCRLIDIQDIKYAIIFCQTKAGVDELTEHLVARGYSADRLHGDMAQMMRERTMRRFRERKLELLVATDVAARGLDVDDIEVVFNYDLPYDAEDYVHRIGRTGRAGRKGRAISFVAGREIWRLQQFMRITKGKIRRETVPTIGEIAERQTNRLFETLKETLEKGEYPRQEALIDELLSAGHSATDIASALLHLLAGETVREATRIPEDDPSRGQRRERPRDEERGRRNDREDRYERGPRPGRERRDDRREFERPPERDFRSRGEREGGRENFRERDRERGYGRREEFGPEERPRRTERPAWGPVSNEPGMTRLVMNVGRDNDIGPNDVVGFVTRKTGFSREAIGAIRIEGRATYFDVVNEEVPAMLDRLRGTTFRGRKLRVDRATEVPFRREPAPHEREGRWNRGPGRERGPAPRIFRRRPHQDRD